MNERLIYVMGPSGAGKDSLLDWLRQRIKPESSIHFARRTIDRKVHPLGEQHESVDADGFESLRQDGSFAMHWLANGQRYGVRHQQLEPLKKNQWVLVNGSRAYLMHALGQFKGMNVLHISASEHILRARLLARRRESLEAIEDRVIRAVSFEIPPECQVIHLLNDTTLEDAGRQMMQALANLPGWPGRLAK
jgi:ribose 1,5-bisphosphokinase